MEDGNLQTSTSIYTRTIQQPTLQAMTVTTSQINPQGTMVTAAAKKENGFVSYRLLNGYLPQTTQAGSTAQIINMPLSASNYEPTIKFEKTDNQPKDKLLWILVDWEADGQNQYHVISHAELLGLNGTIKPGKVVYFTSGKTMIKATVVLASYNKSFIDAELRELRRMAAENLTATNIVADQKYQSAQESMHVISSTVIRQPNQELTNGRSSVTQIKSIEQPPMQQDKIIYARVSNKNQVEVRRSAVMTFDQQTQTDKSNDSSRGDLNQFIMTILENQEKQDRLLQQLANQMGHITDISNQNQNTLTDLTNYLFDLNGKIAKLKPTIGNEMQFVNSQSSEYVVVEEMTEQKSPPHSEGNLIIDEYQVEQNIPQNHSVESASSSFHNETTNASTFSEHGDMTNHSNITTNSITNRSLASTPTILTTPKTFTPVPMKVEEVDGMVLIGNNKTKVRQDVYNSIDWNSYKAATRKLLISLFSRDVLATHSLTGRPSPAFHDRDRPTKDKLDPRIIADIVQTVTNNCAVPESLVRTAITTKCADENKMSRLRNQKRKISEDLTIKPPPAKYQAMSPSDKENSIKLSNVPAKP